MTDETSVAATLPAPCPGEKPRMAMFEVTMIRTEESSNKEFGINLLEGLAAVLTRKSATTFNDTTRLGETVRSRGYELVNSALGATQNALRYSLNIANAAYGKNEVIARPTIAAIDRVPAVFFSGANITLGVVGTGGGASTVIDKPVGVSLAVTPTFIDDDTVMVAIRATRSFIESSVAGSAAVLLQQTRNAISASSMLKFGETYVLSGLVEKAIDSSDSGTPVLRDIPVLQYLFKHSLKTEFSRQILTLVTIRRLVDEEPSEESKKMHEGDVSTHQLSKKVTEFIDVHADKTAIDEAMAGIRSDNQLYQKLLRGRDLLKEGGTEKSRLQGILDSLIEAAYF
jgi:type II secretory pathway component GspD/PulD (secretin)